jgi:hypothetical protein
MASNKIIPLDYITAVILLAGIIAWVFTGWVVLLVATVALLYGCYVMERYIFPVGRGVGHVLDVSTGVRSGTRADLAMERLVKLQELARVYASNMIEDTKPGGEGTEFDNAVLEAVAAIKERFCVRNIISGEFPTSPVLYNSSLTDPNGGIDRS